MTISVRKVMRAGLYVLLCLTVMAGLFLAFVHFYLLPGFRPMMNWNRAMVLSEHLSEVTEQDLRILHLPIPTNEETSMSLEQVHRLCEFLHATGRFPDFYPKSELRDLEGYPYVVTVALRNDRGKRIYLDGKPHPRPYEFTISSPSLKGSVTQ